MNSYFQSNDKYCILYTIYTSIIYTYKFTNIISKFPGILQCKKVKCKNKKQNRRVKKIIG